jgi:hypothetical protein
MALKSVPLFDIFFFQIPYLNIKQDMNITTFSQGIEEDRMDMNMNNI